MKNNLMLYMVAIFLAGTLTFAAVNFDDNMAFAAKDKKNKAKASNNSENISENDANSTSSGISESASENLNTVQNNNTNLNLQDQINNQSIGIGDSSCVLCLTEGLSSLQIEALESAAASNNFETLEELCEFLETTENSLDELNLLRTILLPALDTTTAQSILECLFNLGIIAQQISI